MRPHRIKTLTAASSVAVLLALAGCGDRAGTDTAAAPGSTSGTGGTGGGAGGGAGSGGNAVGNAAQPSAETVTTPDAGMTVARAPQDAQPGRTAGSTSTLGAGAASPGGVASAINDAQITAKVNTGLSVDHRLSATGVTVDAVQGVVTLKGKVPSEEARSRATDIARHVAGVTEVRNELAVEQPGAPGVASADAGGSGTQSMGASGSSSGSPGGLSASDMAITAKVSTGLSVDKDLSRNRIDVDTKERVVTLKGTAPSEEARQRAEIIARNVAEVKEVRNELKVEKSG